MRAKTEISQLDHKQSSPSDTTSSSQITNQNQNQTPPSQESAWSQGARQISLLRQLAKKRGSVASSSCVTAIAPAANVRNKLDSARSSDGCTVPSDRGCNDSMQDKIVNVIASSDGSSCCSSSSSDLSDSSSPSSSNDDQDNSRGDAADSSQAIDSDEADKASNAVSAAANDPNNGKKTSAMQRRCKKKNKRKNHSKTTKLNKGPKLALRRPSCCQCEPIVSCVDSDGVQITDVDLVTYRDLCTASDKAAHHEQHHQVAIGRRSSLQEDCSASAAVQLQRALSSSHSKAGGCSADAAEAEANAIIAKYAWHPPALCTLRLVDEFFARFAPEKVALNARASTAATSTDKAAATDKARQQQQQPATILTGNSYRDEQISLQLPRQDISLDYCSYPLGDDARAAYAQFVDKRNCNALDVARVVQVQLSFGASRRSVSGSDSGSGCNSKSGSNAAQAAPADCPQLVSSRALKCRRCLVRFEDAQLAVVAPNFVIAPGPAYRPASRIRSPDSVAAAAASVDLTVATTTNNTAASYTQPHRGPQTATNTKRTAINTNNNSDAPLNSALFHPSCFTCSTCKEFLVDLVYCLRDNKLYCLRHYGDSIRPRCSWCQELIFSDEYLKAMSDSFHIDHFLCRHCDKSLAGQRYVLKDDRPLCIGCYETNFAFNCESCKQPIGIKARDLSYKDKHWHDTCFLCKKCQTSLIDKPFGSKLDKVYCADCYDATFATRCDGCKNPFRAGSKKMEYKGRQWHDSCFCCCVCKLSIGSNSFIPKNDDIYCIKCYEDKYATRCVKCKLSIVSGGVTFRNEPWHKDCFNCCNCDKSLAGQRFTTREVTNEACENSNKTNQPHNAYCIDCYSELFAKKCYACGQAITGIGGTRFVTFEDRSWHNDCFLCDECQTSLVGKGFITDGPESMLCGECARAKLR